MRKEQNELEFFLQHGSAEKSISGRHKSNFNIISNAEKPSSNVIGRLHALTNNSKSEFIMISEEKNK